MRKFSIRTWIPKKGIVEQIHNGNNVTSAIKTCEAENAFAGVILSVNMLFEEMEVAKLTNANTQ